MSKGRKISWTAEMLETLKTDFPVRFNKELAAELGVGWRTLIRKARELGIEKEVDFLDKNRSKITEMGAKAHPEHPMKGVKGWCVPNSEKTRFKPGNVPPVISSEQRSETRNETIRKERLRIKYGLPQKTKLNLK